MISMKKWRWSKTKIMLFIMWVTVIPYVSVSAQTTVVEGTPKTEAQKKEEAWANFVRAVEDRMRNDWAWLGRYAADNEALVRDPNNAHRVVFMGNSITEGWMQKNPDFFNGNHYINRGIGGQTTPQMLVRFRQDVVNLHPSTVVILAGTNDIAENTGPSKIEDVAGNIISMTELAQTHGIRVILCSVLPALSFPWHPGIEPAPSIIALNKLLKDYAEQNGLDYVDYYSSLVDVDSGLKKAFSEDGVHPNLAGYQVMEPLVQAAIQHTVNAKKK